jgi:hypothetical protein
MLTNLQALAKALGGEVSGSQVLAPGPGHSVVDRSLSVKLDSGAPDGFVTHSFAGDDPIACRDHVRTKAGLEPFKPNGAGRRRASDNAIERALMAAMAKQSAGKPKGRIVAKYDYTDSDGTLLYQVLRLEPKSFRQRRPDGEGGWIWQLDEHRVIYRWSELLKYPDATVFVCEGEKDADRVASLELCATTVAGGRWTKECVQALAGHDVIILQDNDEPGRKKALAAAQALYGSAKTIRIVGLPDLPDKGDVSDWLDADPRRAEKLAEICFEVAEWVPSPAANGDAPDQLCDRSEDDRNTRADGVGDAHAKATLGEWDAGDDTEPPPPRAWLLGNVFARRFISSLFAEGGTGKTAVRYAQYLSLVTGRPLTGEYVFQPCRVLVVSLEDDADELRRRIFAARLHHRIELSEVRGRLFLAAAGNKAGKLMTLDKKGHSQRGALADLLEAIIVKRKIDLISLDPFVKTHAVDENMNKQIDEVVGLLTELAIKHDIAVDIPHHTSKGPADPGNASRGRGASSMKDAGRLIYTLTTMTAEEAQAFGVEEDQRRLLVRMDSAKVNITPPMAKAKWFRIVGVPLGNATELYPKGDIVQTVEPWTPPDLWRDLSIDLLNRILTEIDKGLPDGNRYTNAPKADDRAAWKVVANHAPAKTEGQAREVIKAWVKNGVLISEDYENPTTRKTVKGLRVDNSKRPG